MLPLSDSWLSRASFRAVAVGAFLTLGPPLLHGCGTCSNIEQQYRAWLTDELLMAGTGRSPAPGGEVHVRLLLGNEVLRTIASAASGASPFSPVRMQRRSSASDQAPTYLFRATPTLQNVFIQSIGGQPALQISLVFNGSVNIERRTDAEESAWTARVEIRAPLTLGMEPDGASLRVDLRRATMSDVVSDSTLSNSDDRSTLDAMLVSELQRQLNESSDNIALLRVPSIGAGRGRVELTAVELQQLDASGGLSLGFVTSLRPMSRVLPRSETAVAAREFRVEMVPDLPEAYARYLVAASVVPRLFDEQGLPDPDGIWARSMVSVEPQGAELVVSIERWCFRGGPCQRLASEVGIRLAASDSVLSLSASTGSATTAPADFGRLGDERFVESLIPALGSLFSAPVLVLASGDELEVRRDATTVDSRWIAIHGHMVDRLEEPPLP